MSSIHAVLFDLDGTLLDSAPDLVDALNHLRRAENLDPLEVDDYRQYASHGVVGLLRAGMPSTDGATFESWRLAFLDYYSDHCFNHSVLFEGVRELLKFFEESGIPWGIVTNKLKSLTVPIIAAAGLDRYISCMVCGDTLEKTKPDPAPVRLACELLDSTPAKTLFVGDDIRDLQAGKSAGTQTAAVHYGYGSYDGDDPLVKGSIQIYHPAELIEVVRRA